MTTLCGILVIPAHFVPGALFQYNVCQNFVRILLVKLRKMNECGPEVGGVYGTQTLNYRAWFPDYDTIRALKLNFTKWV